ncbi:ATP-binding cassette domain-containing protein [Paenibacillus alvei]|uniref:ABC transporter ATP-binding protein n=1 Tax=Paenibacillus alvei TaxID=44250 RepID=UPI0018CD3579|nr:ATP-binding cassette domain-containing protein [Paenibacillus alvei]MBG9737882.1 multidrug ABC transporter ATP-binding protein [Paenibacillus alvei]MBG9747574.1 multidrug ABC transporter ATP-binding protein [Paenibacillus alvei]MCY9580886.1 ATP-binding cassette domain-containing protein [Paenibacillus alvei]MCY9585604.1 ATP-binding cassette domain-containing protein [Paenibacillus alvei]
MSAIRVKQLSKTFAYYQKQSGLKHSLRNLFHREQLYRHAVSSISFDIEQGEAVGFIGPNGAGKTTTLKMLSGILHPTAGEARVLGYVPWERKQAFKRRFAIVMGQKSQLWWDLPANESIYLNKCIYGVDDREYRLTLDELAELLDVKHLLGVQVRRLSLGERMKMEMIAALIHRPQLLFLDEPTLGLDFAAQHNVRQFLKAYREEKKATILLTSHYMRDIEHVCSRALVIHSGAIAYDGELSRMSGSFGRRKRMKVRFTSFVPPEQLHELVSLLADVREHQGMSAELEVASEEVKPLARLLLDHDLVEDWTVEEVPVEEIIERLYTAKCAEREGEEKDGETAGTEARHASEG